MPRSARSRGAPGTGCAPALARLRRPLPVVSFSMRPTALVIAVSRRNRLVRDAIVSCQMIGIHKPHAEACRTAGPPDPNPNRADNPVVDGFDDLQRQVLARL
jgi:hypothetical protein